MFSSNIVFTIVAIVIAILISRSSTFFIEKIGIKNSILPKRVYYVIKFTQIIITLLTLLSFTIIWNMEFGGIMIFASSIFAVIGVALFAQWSILSNLTASIIIFFTFPARVGERIKIVDGDNSISGEIKEISLFQIEIIDEDKNVVLYPNNLFIQKPIIKLSSKQKVDNEVTNVV